MNEKTAKAPTPEDSNIYAILRQASLRRSVALLCALALVNLQWWNAATSRGWVAAASAQTAVNSTLAVICVPQTKKNQDEAEQIERLLSDATRRLDTVRLYDLSPVANADIGVKVADLVEDGLRALLLRTPKRGQERLASAVQMLSESPMAGDDRTYARLYKGQGLVLLANNELVKARDSLIKSVVLFPNQTVAEYAAYGGQARELFENVKGLMANFQTGDIKVSAKGLRGEVYVDGIYRGAGTTTVSDLAVGAHRVTVRSSGYVAERKMVDVAANKTANSEFDLKSAPFGTDLEQGRTVLLANFAQPNVVEDRIRELRNQLGADQMLVIRAKLSKKTTELTGFYLGADGQFKPVNLSLDKDEKYLDRIAEFVSGLTGAKLTPDLAATPLDLRQSAVTTEKKAGGTGEEANKYIDPNAPIFDEPEKNEKPITKEWWFWAAVVGGAALLGGGVYLLSKGGNDTQTTATGTLQFDLHATPKGSAP